MVANLQEVQHVVIAMTTFFLIEGLRFYPYVFEPVFLLALILSIVLAFGLHILTKKIIAMHYGSTATFHVNRLGIVISLITMIPVIPVKMITPGEVVVSDALNPAKRGKIALAGLLNTVLLATVFGIMSFFQPIFWFGVIVNIDLALSNLYPVSFLDGKRLFDWNRGAWVLLLAVTVAFWFLVHL